MIEKLNYSYLFRITTAAALGGLLFGFDIAIITGTVPFIRQHFSLSELELGWGVSSLLFGAIFGAAFTGRITDKLGRKKILIWVAILFTLSSFLTGLAPSFTIFVLARILGGLAIGATSVVCPMYIAEIAPFKIRGRLVSIYQLSITTGILMSFFINYILHDTGDNNWRYMFLTGSIPSVLFLAMILFIPESPRFLYLSGLKEKAFQLLVKIGGKKNADEEVQKIEESVAFREVGYKELLKPKYRTMMWVGFGLAVFVQLCGINTIIDYAPIILENAGWQIDTALFSTFVIGLINLLFTFISIYFIDKVGRKFLYLLGSAGLTLVLITITILAAFGQFQGLIALLLILAFIAFFASCIGPVFWTLVSEIFPNHIRGTAMSVPVFTQWIFNALVVLFFPWMMVNAGVAITFGLLALFSGLMLAFTYFFVPETKGKSLEEIQEYWNAEKRVKIK